MMISKLCSAMSNAPHQRLHAENAETPADNRTGAPTPRLFCRELPFRRQPGMRPPALHVAAGAQVLVEKHVVAIDVRLRGRSQLLAGRRRLHLGLRTFAVELVE